MFREDVADGYDVVDNLAGAVLLRVSTSRCVGVRRRRWFKHWRERCYGRAAPRILTDGQDEEPAQELQDFQLGRRPRTHSSNPHSH